jgi:hypothetical protein
VNALDLWHECCELGIVLGVNGERLRYDGPEQAVARMLPLMKANRDALRDCVSAVSGALLDPETGSPYLPWGYATPASLNAMRDELTAIVRALAGVEGWPCDLLDSIMHRAIAGPAYDVAPNLSYFRDRLAAARDEIAARAAIAARSWRYDPAKR